MLAFWLAVRLAALVVCRSRWRLAVALGARGVAGWLLATVLAIASASLSRHPALIVVEHGLALPDKNAEFAALAAKTDDSQVQQSLTNSRAEPMQTSARELQRRIDEAGTAGAPLLTVAGGEYNVRPAPSAGHATR